VDGGDERKLITAAAVAEQVGGQLVGDGAIEIRGIAPLDRAEPDEISLLAHARYLNWFVNTRAGVVLVSPDFAAAEGSPGARIVVDKPMQAMQHMLQFFHQGERRPTGIHPTAIIGESARIGRDVVIEPYAVIGDDVVIGERSWIGPHVVIGNGTTVGDDVRMYAHATVYQRVEIGDRVVLHAGSCVGRDGFGFLPGPSGPVRIPHVGRCVLEHDVEIGAQSCVDRGSIDDTIIGAFTKLDSLVHVAHNVRMGQGCFAAMGVGIAGSSRIGNGVQFGGQSGVGNHVNIGDGASIAARAGAISDVPAKATYSGFPARPHREHLRSLAALARLADLVKPIERLLARRTGGSSLE
jgi:UDP-3-O-[3-hydroxymyristoyl] glucosamine N-acyltransferase